MSFCIALKDNEENVFVNAKLTQIFDFQFVIFAGIEYGNGVKSLGRDPTLTDYNWWIKCIIKGGGEICNYLKNQ
jgi:hypothetical protein